MRLLVRQRGEDPLSLHRQPPVAHFFPSDKCLFCDKQYIQVNRKSKSWSSVLPQQQKNLSKLLPRQKVTRKYFAKYTGRTCKPERHGIITTAPEITLEISAKDTLHAQIVNPLSHRQRIMLHLNTSVST